MDSYNYHHLYVNNKMHRMTKCSAVSQQESKNRLKEMILRLTKFVQENIKHCVSLPVRMHAYL